MPRFEASKHGSRQTSRGTNVDHDLEAQSQATSPQAPTFPGATYGLNPSDQPMQPPRRVRSSHSMKRNQSIDMTQPVPPLPTSPSRRAPPTVTTAPSVTTGAPGPAEEIEDGQEEAEEELAWGPSHPCFPHLNPHVPLTSPEYKSTRIIRIRRDWMIAGDLAPTYSNIYPEILDPLLPETEFRRIIEHINTTLLEAHDPFSKWNWIDGFLGFLTGWLWEDFRPGGIKGKLRGLEAWIDTWNQKVGWRDGVKIIPLRRSGYLGLDIQIPDPQVRVVNDSDTRAGDNDDENDAQSQSVDDDNETADTRSVPARNEYNDRATTSHSRR